MEYRSWRAGAVPDVGGAVTVVLDGVPVVAHPGKQDAVPTWKKI